MDLNNRGGEHLVGDVLWVEVGAPGWYRSDEFMASDLAPWVGVTLLRQFAANLVAAEPLADLYVHSTWALLQRRGSVLEGDPKLAAELLVGTEALASEGDLSAQSRQELEQVHYGVRLFQSRP
jgi:hypothetical protein